MDWIRALPHYGEGFFRDRISHPTTTLPRRAIGRFREAVADVVTAIPLARCGSGELPAGNDLMTRYCSARRDRYGACRVTGRAFSVTAFRIQPRRSRVGLLGFGAGLPRCVVDGLGDGVLAFNRYLH